MIDDFMVVAYYTRNTIYEDQIKRLIQSLKKFNVFHYVEGIDCLGSWYKNTHYKPTFILKVMNEFSEYNIVYVDADAEFMDYPYLFHEMSGNIAAYEFDRTEWNKAQKGHEVMSGTIFFRNNDIVRGLVQKWKDLCKKYPKEWDSKLFERVIGNDYERLPPEYCKIFDLMRKVKHPVIVHYQASREVRRCKNRKVRKIPKLK